MATDKRKYLWKCAGCGEQIDTTPHGVCDPEKPDEVTVWHGRCLYLERAIPYVAQVPIILEADGQPDPWVPGWPTMAACNAYRAALAAAIRVLEVRAHETVVWRWARMKDERKAALRAHWQKTHKKGRPCYVTPIIKVGGIRLWGRQGVQPIEGDVGFVRKLGRKYVWVQYPEGLGRQWHCMWDLQAAQGPGRLTTRKKAEADATNRVHQ